MRVILAALAMEVVSAVTARSGRLALAISCPETFRARPSFQQCAVDREVTARLHPFDVVDPPSHAIVRNLTRIVDPDARRDPDRLALQPGRCGTITYD